MTDCQTFILSVISWLESMVGLGPEMFRKARPTPSMVSACCHSRPSSAREGSPELANAAHDPAITFRTATSWKKGFVQGVPHIARQLMCFCLPVSSKHGLPLIDEVVSMGHAVLRSGMMSWSSGGCYRFRRIPLCN